MSLEPVVVAVEQCGHGRDFFGKQPQVELGVAGLDHAAQEASGFEPTCGVVDIGAVAAHMAGVAGFTFVLDHQLAAQGQIGTGKNVGLRPGQSAAHAPDRRQAQPTQKDVTWHLRAPSWPRSARRHRSRLVGQAWARGPIGLRHRL